MYMLQLRTVQVEGPDFYISYTKGIQEISGMVDAPWRCPEWLPVSTVLSLRVRGNCAINTTYHIHRIADLERPVALSLSAPWAMAVWSFLTTQTWQGWPPHSG